jgi:hypothetical protein
MTRQRRTCIETNNAFISPNVGWLELLTHNSRGQRVKCVRPSAGLKCRSQHIMSLGIAFCMSIGSGNLSFSFLDLDGDSEHA